MKLNYLIEHCSNGAQSLIEDCVLLGARGYRKAKELLDEEYGQESDIAADYLEFLKAGERIEDTDVDALSKLAQDMAKCSVTLKEIDYAADLDAQAALNSIVIRLPSYMRTKWVDEANECRIRKEKPTFETLR